MSAGRFSVNARVPRTDQARGLTAPARPLTLGAHRMIGGARSVKYRLVGVCLVLAFAGAMLFAEASQAQEGGLSLELNRVEQQGEACRFDWRISNRSTVNVRDLTVEFILFDKAGVNIARMPVPFGGLLPNKSYLRSFVLRPFDCDPVGEALVNEVTTCDADGSFDCTAVIAVSSRAAVKLSR